MKTLSLISFMVAVSAFFLPEKVWAQQNPDTLASMPFRQIITGENFNHAGYSGDVLQLISGVAPGLSYTKKGSDPNVPATISVRGYTSEDDPSGVFCIIDGVYGADPRWLSPEDIESFEVITDAAAAAAYGSRGRSGVIVIKTKSHQGNRKFGVNFATTISLNKPTKKLDVLSADEFRTIESAIDEGGSTDWQEEIFRNSVSQNYNLGFSGNLNQTNYRISVFHRNNQGIVRASGARNTGVYLNLSHKALQNRLTLGTTLHFSQGKNEILPNYATSDIRNNIFLNALYRNPTYPVRNPDGSFHELLYYNPVAILEYTHNDSTTNNALMSINGQYQITENIQFGFNTGFSNSKSERDFYQPYNYPSERYYDGMHHSKRFNWEAHLSFQKNINDHNFNLRFKYLGIQENTEIDDEGTDEFTIMDRNRTITQLVPQIDYRYHNFFLSAQINTEFLKNDYTIHEAYHEDGTYYNISYPKKEKLKGFFPAIHAGIDLSQEIGYFDKFMVTAGYGIVGHISNEVLENIMSDVDMERTGEITAGINYELPGQRFSGSLLYFSRNTKNQIREIWQDLGGFLYVFGPTNDLRIRNSGFEAMVHAIPVKTEKIKWNTSFCFFTNKSLVKSTKSGLDDERVGSYYYHGDLSAVQVIKPGNAYPSFYMPEITGYDEYGNPTYKTNSYGRIFFIKGQPQPKIEMGWNNHLCIAEKLTISISLRYAGGYAIFNATKSNLSEPFNLPDQNMNHNGLANYELDHFSSPYDAKYLENASFLRLENVTIGYTFQPKSSDASGNLTVFMGADNLFTWTNYDGYDPAGYSDGIDAFNVYPLARTYNFGLRMNL